jgi:hypothetical protein
VAISSASIPAVTFVITANLPARRHPRNEAINEAIDGSGPELPMAAAKKSDRTKEPFIPKPYCNSFAIARMNPKEVVEWHWPVTRVQHSSIKSAVIQRDDLLGQHQPGGRLRLNRG